MLCLFMEWFESSLVFTLYMTRENSRSMMFFVRQWLADASLSSLVLFSFICRVGMPEFCHLGPVYLQILLS